MKKEVNFNIKSYNRFQFSNLIDTKFSQFNQVNLEEEIEQTNTVTDFFEMYNQLFYEIPQRGPNSHETLINRSVDYIDFVFENQALEALQREITSLREELLEEQQKTALQLQIIQSSSLDGQ